MTAAPWRRLSVWTAALVSVVLFFWAAARAFPHIDQDAWIYFTYYKEFANRPFSFQPAHVTFGATSPLHVLVMAPIYHLFGGWWLTAAKLLNFCFMLAGVVLVHRASGADIRLMPVVVGAALVFETLVLSVATLFETGVTFLLVSILLDALARDRRRVAIAVAGILHLARPELVLVTAVVFAVLAGRHRRLFVRDWCLALLPVASYYGYMWASGAGLVPTSVAGRAILGIEFPTTWTQKVQAILQLPEIWPYAAGLAASLVAVVVAPRRAAPAMVVIAPIVVLYAVVPPGWAYFAPRYLVPVIPAFLYCFAILLDRAWRTVFRGSPSTAFRGSEFALAMGTAVVGTLIVAVAGRHEPWVPYTHDTILQKDLAEAVAGIVRPGDRVLMYEIQGQYYFPGHGISADGIVGREAHDFLFKRQTFDELVVAERLKFVVTFNAFNYRRVFAGTPLVDLYTHDLKAAIGDELCLGRFCYQKVAGNPHFNEWYVEQPARSERGHDHAFLQRRVEPQATERIDSMELRVPDPSGRPRPGRRCLIVSRPRGRAARGSVGRCLSSGLPAGCEQCPFVLRGHEPTVARGQPATVRHEPARSRGGWRGGPRYRGRQGQERRRSEEASA